MNSDCKVFFTKVPSLMSVDDLRLHFETVGTVRNIHYGKDNKYGFVTFLNAKEADKAINDLNNKPPYYLKVDYPKRTEKPIMNNREDRNDDIASLNGFNGSINYPASNDIKVTEIIDYLVKIKDPNFIQYLNDAAREYVEKNISTINPIFTSYNILENNLSKLLNGNSDNKFNEFKPMNKSIGVDREDRNCMWSSISSSKGYSSSFKSKQYNNDDKLYGKSKLKSHYNDSLCFDVDTETRDDDIVIQPPIKVSKTIEKVLNEIPKSSSELNAWSPPRVSKLKQDKISMNIEYCTLPPKDYNNDNDENDEEEISIRDIPKPIISERVDNIDEINNIVSSPEKFDLMVSTSPKVQTVPKIPRIRSFINKQTIANFGFVELYSKLSENYIIGSCVFDEYCDCLSLIEADAAKNINDEFIANVDDYCFGLRQGGDEWARGKVLEKIGKRYVMALIDYGLKEIVDEVRPMSDSMFKIPSFAIKAETTNPDENINKVYNIKILEKNDDDLYVVLTDEVGKELGTTMILKPFYVDVYY